MNPAILLNPPPFEGFFLQIIKGQTLTKLEFLHIEGSAEFVNIKVKKLSLLAFWSKIGCNKRHSFGVPEHKPSVYRAWDL